MELRRSSNLLLLGGSSVPQYLNPAMSHSKIRTDVR